MSPAIERGTIADEDYFFSIGATDPTLTSDQEGWIHYNPTVPELKVWNGSAWKVLPFAPVSDANLRDSAALSVIGRSANSTGDPADIATTANSNHVLRETSVAGVRTLTFDKVGAACMANDSVETAAIKDLNVTLPKIAAMGGGGPGLMIADVAGNADWKGPANYPAAPLFKDASSVATFPRISGTTFPTSPVDGQRFYHTTHKFSYIYDSSASGWLSESVFEIPYGNSADLASSAYAELGEVAAFPTYSSTAGHLFGFAVKVIGISLNQAATPGGNVTVEVWDDGAAVASSSAQLVTALQSDAIETLMSTTIASKSIISVRIAGGTAEGPFRGIVRFRRFET